MLRPFLKWLERNGCVYWVWKAEAQKNGNIHFHITVNNFVHWKSIRRKWNELQSAHGYHKVFTKGRAERGMNSTDVHSVKSAIDSARYMAKYITKTQKDRRLIEGRLWACSVNLSSISLGLDEHCRSGLDELDNWLSIRGKLLWKDDFVYVYTYEHIKFNKLPPYLNSLCLALLAEHAPFTNRQTLLQEVESFR